ncbi:hypothetical protein [Burkholderia alba]|uniref:hypothetical protein n=1 Tax=Burkholderia alba TaxID=2683677 RepID=UPI002B05EE9D|nr:hypothetical protein [Burkholderia alba]
MDTSLDCPSSQPGPGSRVIGVVLVVEKEQRIAPLKQAVPLEQIAHLVPDSVPATEIVRLASPCQTERCQHYLDEKCSLASRIVKALPEVVNKLPHCSVRKSCRWWFQEGMHACMRCPQIVTEPFTYPDRIKDLSIPLNTPNSSPQELQNGQ